MGFGLIPKPGGADLHSVHPVKTPCFALILKRTGTTATEDTEITEGFCVESEAGNSKLQQETTRPL